MKTENESDYVCAYMAQFNGSNLNFDGKGTTLKLRRVDNMKILHEVLGIEKPWTTHNMLIWVIDIRELLFINKKGDIFRLDFCKILQTISYKPRPKPKRKQPSMWSIFKKET